MKLLTSTLGRALDAQHAHVPGRQLARHLRHPRRSWRRTTPRNSAGAGGEPDIDWEQETSIFKKRTLKPSQLEALRNLEASQLEVGRVLYCEDSIAIVEGLNNDADVGTALSFASGAKGVLLWRRSDNVVFALLLGGADKVVAGDGVECKVKGILQVVDDTEGPTTKRDYEQAMVPVGEELVGKVVDFIGRPLQLEGLSQHAAPAQHSTPSTQQPAQQPAQQQQQPAALAGPDAPPAESAQQPLGLAETLPLLNAQVDMERREQINQPLMTGVKSVDVLTPIGRGQSLLVCGPRSSGKTQICIDAILGQKGAGVRCVYAATNCTAAQLAHTVAELESHGALEYTTVVGVTNERPLGEQFAGMLMACCVGEAVRDAGGHALVVVNDISPMVRMWEEITVALAGLGPVALELERPQSDEGSADEDDLVEYEGMLVSVQAAQRRRFFSSLLQRAAKMHRRLKGGSMTLLTVAPGTPASGEARKARETILKYRHLSEEQKAKLLHALEAKQTPPGAAAGEPQITDALRTEVIEELMSISDGQVVLRRERDPATGGVTVNPQASCSRIGSRAYHLAMAALAPQVRLDLAQAVDAERYAGAASGAGASDPVTQRTLARAALLGAALAQPLRSTVPLEGQVAQLLAVQRGLLDRTPQEQVAAQLGELVQRAQQECPAVLQELAETCMLTAAAEAELMRVLSETAAGQPAGQQA